MYARYTSQFSNMKWMFLSLNVCVLYHKSHVTVTYVGHPGCLTMVYKLNKIMIKLILKIGTRNRPV